VQLLCHHILKELKGGTLVIEPEHLEAAVASRDVQEALHTIFEMNVTDPASKILVHRLAATDTFTMKTAHQTLQSLTEAQVPIGIVETLLRDLIISGFLNETGGRYGWTIPILRDVIVAADNYKVEQLEKELPPNPAAWAARMGG
jgi:hypothetical protein